MSYSQSTLVRLAVGCLLIGLAAGCASGRNSFWSSFGRKTSDSVAGVVAPVDRIAALRARAKEAARAGGEQREVVGGELEAAYRQEDDPLVRVEIVGMLADYPTQSARSALETAVGDSSPEVRIAACRAWGKRGGPDAVAVLSRVVGSDTDGDVRKAAIKALGDTRDPGAVAALGPALDERDPATQYLAIESLKKTSGQNLGNDVGRWRQYVKGETPAPAESNWIADRLGLDQPRR